MDQLLHHVNGRGPAAAMEVPAFERHLAQLRRDFHIEVAATPSGDAYKLGTFKAFTGQDDHLRHEAFVRPSRIS
jgi:DNA (cytosine-5)-methyltransferase 1